MSPFLFKEETYQIIGACYEVYNTQGSGFLESVYQECLQIELGLRRIPFAAQLPLNLEYKGQPLIRHFLADIVCFGKIIVEIKAVSAIHDAHRAQLLNYLHATGLQLGLLVNFGQHPKLEYQRMVLTHRR